MLEDIFSNLVVSAISGFIVWILKIIVKGFQNANDRSNTGMIKTSRSKIKNQFFICAFAFPILFGVGLLIPCPLIPQVPMDFLLQFFKVACLITAFFSFILEWGAFEAAFNYESNDFISIPAQKSSHGNTEK